MKYDYSITLKNPQSLYCPVINAEMSIISQEVSELGVFSKILIWAFGRRYSKLQILEITNLPILILEEEIDYLIKIEILENEDQGLKLTGLGFSYFKKIEVTEDFNDQRLHVLINCVTGEVLEKNLELSEKHQLSSDEFILRQRIIPDLYGNLNPSNSKEFLLEKYELHPLSDEEKSFLDVTMKLKFQKEKDKKQFIRYELQHVPFIVHGGIVNSVNYENLTSSQEVKKYEETHSLLSLMYPIQKGKLVIKNPNINSYRNLLSTLKKIGQFDAELISAKSINLLEEYEEEQKLQKNLNLDIFFDSVSGVLTTSLNPEHRIEKNIRNEILIPPIHNLEDLLLNDYPNIIRNLTGVEVDNIDIMFVVEEEFYLKINANPLNILNTNR